MKVVVAEVHTNLFDGEAHSVTAPTTEGEVTILPKHAPFAANLKAGVVVVRAEKEYRFPVTEGVIETSNNTTTVLL